MGCRYRAPVSGAWVIGAGRLLQPLHNLMRDTLTDGPFLHLDETVVQVLKEDGKIPTSTRLCGCSPKAREAVR